MQERVLVIDNTMSGWDRCQALASQGYAVDIAPTAEEGLELLHSQRHDAIIIEDRPGAESWQLCAKIRQFSRRPLIVISPGATSEASVKAFEAGADYFLRCPFGSLELCARVNSLLRRASARTYTHIPYPAIAISLS